jgi:two-component system, OmpR family, sensor kinase
MRLKLSTRLTLFFLAAHALVLASFSISLYLIAAKYLQRQADERVESAINTLVAAAEIGPTGVEWEPEERRVTFSHRTVEGSFFWEIVDESGHRLDGSTPAFSSTILGESAAIRRLSRKPQSFVASSGTTWRIADRLIQPEPGSAEPFEPSSPEKGNIHQALWIRAGLSLGEVRSTLRNLAGGLAAISGGVFLLTLGVSYALCRRAVRPVTEMANAAHAIQGADPGERLPTPQSGDELEELGQSFNSLLDRLSESYIRQKAFTGDASHQLRTPVTAMLGQIDLALKKNRSVEEYRNVLGLLQRKTRHLRQIIESLLFLARADAEVPQPTAEPIDLMAWLPAHVASWQDAHANADIRLAVEHTGPTWVRAQPVLLGELLNNLLDNALKYSDRGARITVSLARDGMSARIVVEDQGIGMTEEEVERVFEPFFRGRTARAGGSTGLGLGLAVAARLAKVFGGTIDVATTLGHGSQFVVRLPIAAGPANSDNLEAAVESLTAPV